MLYKIDLNIYKDLKQDMADGKDIAVAEGALMKTPSLGQGINSVMLTKHQVGEISL